MPRRPTRRRSTRRLIWVLAGSSVLLAVGIYGLLLWLKPPPPPVFTPPAPPPKPPPTAPPPRPAPPTERPATQERASRPRIALVIDDLGRSLEDLDTLAKLGIPLTYAVLPFESRTAEVVEALQQRGAEIVCHLPMEAQNHANPGPGALRASMDRDELKAATRRALAAVPGASGVNNHMGSGLSAQRDAMTPVLEVVAAAGLYYLDSRTSPETLGYEIARELGMAAGERQVFLDTDRSPAALRRQFERLLAVAAERGQAIAIAHPHPETLALLAAEIPQAKREFEFVTASALLTGG